MPDLSSSLEPQEKHLLRRMHEGHLLDRIITEARWRLFNEFEKSSPDERELIGHKVDALGEVRRVIRTIIQEAHDYGGSGRDSDP